MSELETSREAPPAWTVEVFKIGNPFPQYPKSYDYEITYRHNPEQLQRMQSEGVMFEEDGSGMKVADTERLQDFMERYPNWQLVWQPGEWVPGLSISDTGRVSDPSLRIIGWEDMETEGQVEEYMAHKAEHEKRFS
ncbi:MAG TPA: hypothetical protein VMT23_02110 [Candidatus Binatia bacterium]|nr:hypothetical protein [Candidatus Binatia bacterium]